MDGIELSNLFYTLQLNSQQFDSAILQSGSKLKDFTDYAASHPLAVVGALSVAFIGVGVEAVKMADGIDVAMRKIVASIPQAQGKLDGLRQTIQELSQISPQSQGQLADAAATIAERGAASVEDIQARLKVAVQVADASGADLGTVVEGLGGVIDAFHLTTQQGTDALVRLFAAAQGKVPLEDLFTVLDRGKSVLASLGVSAEDAGDALAALIAGGVPNRQAGTVLTQILQLGDPNNLATLRQGTEAQQAAAKVIQSTMSASNIATNGFGKALEGLAAGLEKIGGDSRAYGIQANTVNAIQRAGVAIANDHRTAEEKDADALAKLTAAAETNNGAASALYAILKNNLSVELEHLGNDILPGVTKALGAFDDILRSVIGHSDVGTKLQDSFQALQDAGDKITSTRSSGVKSLFVDAGSTPLSQLQSIASGLTAGQANALSDALGANPGAGGDQLQDVSKTLAGLKPLEVEYIRLATVAKAAQAAFEAANTAAGVDNGTKPKTPPAGGDASTLTATQIEALKQQLTQLGNSMYEALAGSTKNATDNAIIQMKRFSDNLDELKKKAKNDKALAPDLKKDQNAYNALSDPNTGLVAVAKKKDAQDLADQMQQALVATTASTVDDLQLALDKELQTLKDTGVATAAQIQHYKDLREETITLAASAETLSKAQADIANGVKPGSGALPQLGTDPNQFDVGPAFGRDPNQLDSFGQLGAYLNEANQLKEAIREAQNQTGSGPISAAQVQATKEYEDVLQKITALQDKLFGAQVTQPATTFAATIAGIAGGIANAANAAFGLASALGGADAVAAKLFGSIGEVAGGISSISTLADKAGGFGALFSSGAGIASAIPGLGQALGGAIALGAGLIAKSPEEVARIQNQKENTLALQQLTEKVGALGSVNVTGTNVQKVTSALGSSPLSSILSAAGINPAAGDFTADGSSGLITKWSKDFSNSLNAALTSVGLSFQDFQAFAKQYNITIADTGATVQNIGDLDKAISETKLTTFGDDFAGQTAKFNAAVTLLDLTTPTQQLKEFIQEMNAVAGGSGILGKTIAGFDLSNAAGVASANTAIQNLFNELPSLTPADTGGLSGEDFLNALTAVKGIITSAQQATGTGGFNTETSITETTGERMGALLSTSNVFLSQIAANTAQDVQLLSALFAGGPPPLITAPSVPAGGFSATNATFDQTVTFAAGAFVFNITVPAGSDPVAVGQAVAAAVKDPKVIQVISQGLQKANSWAARSQGVMQ